MTLFAIIALVVVGIAVVKITGGSGGGMAQQIAYAIGVAEGGYDSSGNNLNNNSRPSRNHNPGDLTVDVNGTATGTDSQGFTVYATDAAGFAALLHQVMEWLDGTSANAGPTSTIADISEFYTTTDQSAWAANVASALGVSVDTPIGQIGGGVAASESQVAASSPDSTTVASVSGDSNYDQQADDQGDNEDDAA